MKRTFVSKFRHAACAAAIVLLPSIGAADVLYVDANATGPTHDGSSWCEAYLTLSDALTAASSGTDILVADGTYLPDTTGLVDPREATFQLISGVAILGGHAGCGAVDPDERLPETHVTILSGDLSQDDLAVGNAENSYHVVTGTGADASAMIDGVTVTAGHADGASTIQQRGGGMYTESGSPTVQNCVFEGNESSGAGGAMRNNTGGNPLVIDCTFIDNVSGGAGAAISNFVASPMIKRCWFESNVASGNSGGVNNEGGFPVIIQSTFYKNEGGRGGAMRNFTSNSVQVISCRFIGNVARHSGGAINNRGGSQLYFNCVFSGNEAPDGGGMCNDAFASPSVINCTFSENVATDDGGGMYQTSFTGGSPKIHNSIFWNNIDSGGIDESAQIHTQVGNPEAYYSDIHGGWTGIGANNIAMDPLFVDPLGGDGMAGTLDDDLNLSAASPCIDAGDNTVFPLDEHDVDNDYDTTERYPWDGFTAPRFEDDPLVVDTGVADLPDYPGVLNLGALETVPVNLSVTDSRPGGALRLSVAPNPFGPSVQVAFRLSKTQRVRVSVYGLRGERVRTLADRAAAAGLYTLTWDGRDDRGRLARPGVYFVRVDAGSASARRSIVRIE